MLTMNSFAERASPPKLTTSAYDCSTDFYLDSPSPATALSPLTSIHDYTFSNEYPSPEQTEGTTDMSQPELQEPAPNSKRKRENRYKNAPPSVLSRRRAQNRASQRAYRERKDQRIKDLEVILDETQKKHETLAEAYANLEVTLNETLKKHETLTEAYANLEAELGRLKSQHDAQVWQPSISWDPTITSPALDDILLYFPDPTTATTTNF